MGCCGQSIEQFRGTGPTFHVGTSHATMRPAASLQFSVCFEYTGRTSLSVIGPVSGQHYYFEAPGARLVVDPRDQLALDAVPELRRVPTL